MVVSKLIPGRMNCLRIAYVPTFYPTTKTPETSERQLDYVFASESIADRVSVRALNSEKEWGPSDHGIAIILQLFYE